MKGIYLTYISTSEGERKLVPRLEEHVRPVLAGSQTVHAFASLKPNPHPIEAVSWQTLVVS